jgi:hypothetical protein
VGVQDSPPGTSACGLPFGTTQCASCVQSNCCTEATACESTPACNAFESCLGRCKGDAQCRSQCSVDDPRGTDPNVSPLSACVASKCETACGLTCGGVIYGIPAAASACQKCVAANGCGAAREAGTSAQWLSFRQCQTNCDNARDCAQLCVTDNEAGANLSTSFFTAVGQCGTQCELGSQWDCVGHVTWPSAGQSSVSTVQMTVEVQDFLSNATLANIDVSVCARQDVTCANPVGHGTTDGTGHVVMQVTSTADFQGLGLDGYLLLQSPQIVTYLWYWGFPLSEPQVEFVRSSRGAFLPAPVTPAEYTQLITSVGMTYDAMVGVIGVDVYDCDPHGAVGVQISNPGADAGARVIYDFSTTATVTASSGIATVGPLQPGVYDLTMTPVSLGVASSVARGVVARANALTVVNAFPTP